MIEQILFGLACWVMGIVSSFGLYYAIRPTLYKRDTKEIRELLIDGCRVLYWCTELIDGPMGQYPKRKAAVWFDEAWKKGFMND